MEVGNLTSSIAPLSMQHLKHLSVQHLKHLSVQQIGAGCPDPYDRVIVSRPNKGAANVFCIYELERGS
jgi:hypothetical protein